MSATRLAARLRLRSRLSEFDRTRPFRSFPIDWLLLGALKFMFRAVWSEYEYRRDLRSGSARDFARRSGRNNFLLLFRLAIRNLEIDN